MGELMRHTPVAQSSHQQIARALGSEILAGVYPPGSTLPNETALLTRFQISRTVLREVIKTLTAKGLVVAKTRIGTRVLDPAHWNFFDAEVLSWKVGLGMDDAFRQSLVEVRRSIEPAAAALAARRRTAEDLVALRGCIAAMAAPDHTRESFAEADRDFHLRVGAASGNPLMRSLAGVIETALIASFSLSSPTGAPDLQAGAVEAHKAIVDAIEIQDAKGAEIAMLAVIDVGHERIESYLADARRPGSK
jgi:DNA-binding FadR family transcriptional regulator